MGWWSVDIMGGDTPLDVEDAIYDLADIEKYPDDAEPNEVPKEFYTKENVNKIIEETKDLDSFINLQVLAIMMMQVGAVITDDLKQSMITACKKDHWSKSDTERKQKTKALKKALKSYDNINPIIITSKGLFETIFNHVDGGKSGLVNKNV